MLNVRVTNNNLGRALHASLYTRLLTFCAQYTPEMLAEPVVQSWLQRVYANDSSMHMIVTLDDTYNILAHAVIEIQQMYNQNIITCHQVQSEKNSVSAIVEGMEYIDKLATATDAVCTIVYMAKHTKALQKLGYDISRTVMIKKRGDDNAT